jgi:hypothetical protein
MILRSINIRNLLIQIWASTLKDLIKMAQRPPKVIDPHVNEDIIFSGPFENRNALDAGLGKY